MNRGTTQQPSAKLDLDHEIKGSFNTLAQASLLLIDRMETNNRESLPDLEQLMHSCRELNASLLEARSELFQKLCVMFYPYKCPGTRPTVESLQSDYGEMLVPLLISALQERNETEAPLRLVETVLLSHGLDLHDAIPTLTELLLENPHGLAVLGNLNDRITDPLLKYIKVPERRTAAALALKEIAPYVRKASVEKAVEKSLARLICDYGITDPCVIEAHQAYTRS